MIQVQVEQMVAGKYYLCYETFPPDQFGKTLFFGKFRYDRDNYDFYLQGIWCLHEDDLSEDRDDVWLIYTDMARDSQTIFELNEFELIQHLLTETI